MIRFALITVLLSSCATGMPWSPGGAMIKRDRYGTGLVIDMRDGLSIQESMTPKTTSRDEEKVGLKEQHKPSH